MKQDHLVLEARFERLVHARTGAVHKARRPGCPASHPGPAQTGDHDPEQAFYKSLYNLPAAAYTTDAEGRITHYNDAAALLWGRHPEIGQTRWCGSWNLYTWDEQPLAREMCPM